MLLTDRNAVISGVASACGIGRATARLFANQGVVAILDLDARESLSGQTDPIDRRSSF
jgi:NAD(P)-dependent dehydrogenase (short-subunit alcohol dehydrogenase family)